MSDSSELKVSDFLFDSSENIGPGKENLNLEEIEKGTIKNAIKKYQGNLSKAAKELGLGRTTLYRKMNKYGI